MTIIATGEVGRLVAVMNGEIKTLEIQAALGLKHEDHFREKYLKPAIEAAAIEMTIPDKPRSSRERYCLPEKGKITCIKSGRDAMWEKT